MTGLRKTLCNDKARWLQRCRQVDLETAECLNRNVRTPHSVPLAECFRLAARIRNLGFQAEYMYSRAARMHMSHRLIEVLRNGSNQLELFSMLLREMAEKSWGTALPSFPSFASSLNASVELLTLTVSKEKK